MTRCVKSPPIPVQGGVGRNIDSCIRAGKMDFKISLQRDAGRSVASSAAFAGASRERRGQGKSDFFWHFVPNILGYLAPQYVPNTFSTRLQLVVKAGAKIFGKGHHLKCGYRISGDSYNSGWAQDGLGERACARRKTQISQEIQLTQILSIPSSASYRASTHCPSAIVDDRYIHAYTRQWYTPFKSRIFS